MGGRKRRFLLFGVVNVLLTNGALLLLLHLVSIGLATFLSQVLNVVLGFWLYGKQVFRVERLVIRAAAAYGGMAVVIWLLNWQGIRLLTGAGLARSWAAVAMVPLLAALSYGVQKTLVFRPDPALQSVAAASAPDPATGMGQRL